MKDETKTPAISFDAIEDEIKVILSISDDELDESEKARVLQYLNELAQAEADKVDRVAYVARHIEGNIDIIKNMIGALQAKKKSMENALVRLKARFLNSMQTHDIKKIKGSVFTISRRTTKSVECNATPAELNEFPMSCKRISITPSLDGIKAELKAGKQLPHCKFIEKESIMIR